MYTFVKILFLALLALLEHNNCVTHSASKQDERVHSNYRKSAELPTFAIYH